MSTVGTDESSRAPTVSSQSDELDCESNQPTMPAPLPRTPPMSPSRTEQGVEKSNSDIENDSLKSSDISSPKVDPLKTPSKVLYRVEYKNKDGEIVLSRQEEDPEKLLPKVALSTVLEVLTIVSAPTSKKASDVKDSAKAPTQADAPAGSSDQPKEDASAATIPDGFERNFTTETQIIIRSEKLLNALRAVITYLPNKTLIGRDVSFPEPYHPLIYYREELEAYKNQHPPQHSLEYQQECNEHIDILLKHLSETSGKAIEAEKQRHARDPPVCTFEYLWLLFKPGEACYCKEDDGNVVAYITASTSGGLVDGVPKKYTIRYWNLDFNGWEVGQEMFVEYVIPFDGEKEIRSLNYCPVAYHQEEADDLAKYNGVPLYERLVSKGRRWWDICRTTCQDKYGSIHVEYDGSALSPPYKKVVGRQVIDPHSYFASILYTDPKHWILKRPLLEGDNMNDYSQGQSGGSGCACTVCSIDPARQRLDKFKGYHKINPKKDDPPNETTFFFLTSHRVFAFQLRERYWEAINVADIREITASDTAFSNLVLNPSVKDTIKALSKSFTRSDSKRSGASAPADFIKGKGEGRVFLLHGPPGVGKTATAEAIAEMTKRPLLALTCGDLGTVAKDVELSLSKYMFYGENWGAVVLLDEADIYLERRSVTDIKRNGLVSVFLRALEYYKGLLFLTTNRVGTFDEAFTSRIHVSLHYKKLTDEDRQQIWINSITRLAVDNVKVTKQARKYVCEDKDVSILQWNGREIRNALQTAVALADFKAPDRGENPLIVRQEHLEEVVNLSGEFKRYMKREHGGHDASTLAKRQGLRNDAFGETTKRGSRFSTTSAHATPQKVSRKVERPPSDDDEDDEDEDEEEVQLPRNPKAKAKAQKPEIVEPESEDEDEEKYRKPKSTKSKGTTVPASDEDRRSSDKRKTVKKNKPATIREEEEEEDEEEEADVPRPSKTKASKKSKKPETEEEEESEEVEKRTSSSRKQSRKAERSVSPNVEARNAKAAQKKKQQQRRVPVEEESESEEED